MPTRWVAACCLAVVGVACSPQLDVPELETEISRQLSDQLERPGWTVDCPDEVQPEAGATFGCTATDDGDRFRIEVTQDDAEGSVTWRIVE